VHKISDVADTIVYNIYQLDSRIDPGTNAPPQMEILLADQDAVDDWVDMMGKNLKPGFTVKDIAETVNGQLLRRKQVTYTVHRAFHMPQVKNGILFGVKKAMAHGDPTKYKFPDINIGDEKQIGSIAWKNKHVGTPLHSFMQYIIEGKSFDDAYDQAKIDGLATIDKQMLFKNVYQPEMKKIAAIRAAGGEVMAETSIGHSGLKVGGKVDRVVVYGDGKTKIVDYKTSDAKVYDSNGNLNPSYTNPGTGGLASKEDGHFTQLETYAYVMGSKEDFGGGNVREAINVNEVEVMPIHFELDSSGRITDISLEKPITKPTTVDSTIKAGELLEKFYDAYIKVVQPGNNFIVPKTMEKVAEENHMKNLTTINSEIATNRTILQKLNAEKKAAVAAGNATLLNELNPKINSLIEKNENLLYQKKALQNLYEAYKQDLISISKIMEQNPKIEKLSTSELIVIYNQLVNYSMSAKNEYISALLKQVKYRLIADQALPTTENEGDITTRQVWSMAPSHFSEKLPVIRELMKHQLVATQKAENNVKRVLAELDKLDEAVRKEWDKNYSKNKIKLVKSTGSQYYENLYKKENGIIRPEYKSINDPTLNDAERAYLKFIWEYKQLSHIETRLRGANNNLATEVGALLVPESVFEEYHNNGFFAALHKFIGKNKRLNDVMVYGEKPIVDPATGKLDWVKGLFRYSDLINALDTPNVKSAVGLVKHTYYHTKYTLRAKKLLAKGFHDSLSGKGDGNAISSMSYINSHFVRNGEVVSDRVLEPMARTIDAQMQLRSSWFYGRSKNSEFSKDVHSAMQRFVMDMEFEAAMTEKSIELDNSSMSVMDLATIAQLSVQAAKLPNATRWMELWVNRELLGKGSEKYVSDLDRMASNFLISWTYLLIMTWNWKLGFFNLTTGILNNITFTDDYLKNNAKRLFEGGSPLWGKNNKARALWDAYEIVAYRPEVPDGSLSGRIVKWSSWFISAGEKVIQQTAFLARVPQAVWDNIDVDGDGKLTWKDPNGPQLDEKTITELKIKSSDVQGKYDPHDRRNYHGVAHLQLAMQFKTWLPDTFRQFFDGGSVDVFGNKHVGIVNAAGLWMKWALEAPTKGMAEANANYQQYASLEEYKAAQKNAIKSIAIMSAMWIMWAGLHGDDEDKEQADMLQSAMKQYMGMLDPDNLVAMISLPALNTIEKTKDAFMAIIGRAVYERDSRWGEAGEPKGFDKLIQAMPYRNLFAFDILGVKSPLLNENYGSGFGGGSFGGGGAGGSFGDSSQGGFDNFDSF
jgi:hypothetical protein